MRKIVSVLLIGVLVLSAWQKCESQTTWVRTYNIDYPSSTMHFDSATVGPLETCVTPNGTIITLMQINQGHATILAFIDSLGNIIWKKPAAYYGGIFHEDCYSLHETADNGCVYISEHIGSYLADSVFRISSSGAILWAKYFMSSPLLTTHVVSISPTYYNTSYLQFRDSLVELDSLGNYIRSRVPFSWTSKIIAVPDSDFIRADSSIIYKEDFTGIQRWSLYAPGYYLVSANMSFVYAQSGNQVMKINTSSGNVIWTKYINTSAMSSTSDEGFIDIGTNQISKYDSSGTLQWNKNIMLPYFGLKTVREISSKSYITGGCWKNMDLYYNSGGFSPLLLRIDSLGNGVVDSTDYFFNGNANDNTTLSFADDAVYIAAALNNSGISRDNFYWNTMIGLSVYSPNWPGRFASGLNYKYSDANGNGIVDTSDISLLSKYAFTPPYWFPITPHWLKVNHSSNVPDLTFAFENDSINYADTIKINVILGSQSVPADSIYGLSFDLFLQNINTGFYLNPIYTIKPTSLGDTSINLYSFFYYNTLQIPKTSMVLCRTDHTNAFVAGDTIASIYYMLPINTIFTNPITIGVNWNAITEAGFPISLNLITDTLILTGTTGINNLDHYGIKLFPNPANDQLLFTFNSSIDEIIVNDETGREILTKKNPEREFILNVKYFMNGVYYASFRMKNNIYNSKFIVLHE